MPLSPRQSRVADGRTLSTFLGAAIAAFGFVVLGMRLGGMLDASHALPRGTSALMFVAAGIGLIASASPDPASVLLRRATGGTVVLIALLCILGQLTGDATTSPLGDGGGVSPVPTASAFIAAGLAITLSGVRPVALSYLATLLTGLVVLVAVDAYCLGLRPTSSALAGTSPGALVGLALLTLGLLALTPHLPPFTWLRDQTTGARLARLLVPTILVLPLVFGVVLTQWEQATGLDENVGIAVIVAALTTTLTSITAVTIRVIDRAELQGETARREAEEAVRESERRFRLLALQMPVGVVSRSLDGEIIFANQEAMRLFGLPEDAHHDEVTPEFFHPADLEQGAAAMRRTIETGEPWEAEIRIFRVDGEQRRVVVRGSLHDVGEEHVYLATLRDVTEQRAAEAAERKASAEFRIAFDQAPIGMLVLDLEGQNTRVNDALCQMTGRTAEWILASAPLEMVHPDDVAAVTGAFQRLGRETESLALAHRWLHHDGHVLWVDARVTLVRDEDGHSDHVMAQIFDITDQRTHEAKLHHLAEHDSLTGLLNRRGFEHRLIAHVARVRRYDEGGALLLIDLDGFKLVNDTLGHAAGDALLMGVAGVLSERLRESDVIARLGGDEFAVILPHEQAAEALEAANAIVDLIARNAATLGGVQGRVSASVGVADFATGLTSDEMLLRGDRAMYHAKQSGKGRAAAYESIAAPSRLG